LIKLYRNEAVLHSLVWLGIYLVLNTITGNIAEAVHVDAHQISAIPNLLLALVCFFYLIRTGIAQELGLTSKPTEKASVMLYYLPLLALPCLNLLYGVNTSLGVADILFLLAMYTGVGFMEEIIFRGMMFKALLQKWNRILVVAFISFTFAIGHLVSMVAVGQSGLDTSLQIINALVVGFMFMAVILADGNLRACIIAHILYNFLANISLVGSTHKEIIVANAVITAAYFGYLLYRAPNTMAFFQATKK
jgi:uncharacterized protein